MVSKKSDVVKKADAGKPAPAKPAPEKTGAGPANSDVVLSAADPQAAVIAELIKSGMTYAQALASMGIEAPTAAPAAPTPKINVGKDPGADEVIDEASIPDPGTQLEVVEISNEPREGFNMLEELYTMRKTLETSRKEHRFQLTLTIDQRLFDWVVYAAIVEAQMRGRPDLSIEDFLQIRLKELMAADPTKGGRRDPSKSGPKDAYNPTTGGWK